MSSSVIGNRDRLLGRGQRELPMGAHAFALGRDERRGLFPRRLNHDPRGVAGLVGAALGHELDAVVVEPRPRGVAVAERVERGPRRREPLVRVARGRLEDEVAAVWQRRARAARARRRSSPSTSRLGLPFARCPTCRSRCLRRGGRSSTESASASRSPSRRRRPGRRARRSRPRCSSPASAARSTTSGEARCTTARGARAGSPRLAMCCRETSSTSPSSVYM